MLKTRAKFSTKIRRNVLKQKKVNLFAWSYSWEAFTTNPALAHTNNQKKKKTTSITLSLVVVKAVHPNRIFSPGQRY